MKKNRPVDKLYKMITNAQQKLDAIRKKCKHKKTRIGLYSWRVGAVDTAELCNTCDAVVDNNSMVFRSGGQFTGSTINIPNSNIFGEMK